MPRIRVSFEVDADGLLSVTAQEESSGVQAKVEVKPSYGLSDSEIETMLTDSMTYAEEDMHARKLREEQVEGERVIEALSAALAEDGEQLLDGDERQLIDTALQHLVDQVKGSDAEAIKQAVLDLESSCSFYVERRMNSGIKQAMAGRKVEEF